jgi:hypothetical protein
VRQAFESLGEHDRADTLLDAIAARARSLPSDLAACILEPDDDPALTAGASGRDAEPAAQASA